MEEVIKGGKKGDFQADESGGETKLKDKDMRTERWVGAKNWL